MSHSHDDTAPVEHDPTGMRALLANLPEPGPMPDDLVARISAALTAEAERGDGIDQLWHLHDDAATASGRGVEPDAGAQVVPLRRRLGLRHLGVAAAVVGVLGLGGFLVKSVPGDVVASFGTVGGSSDSGAVAESDAGSQREQALVAPEAGSGEVVVVMSGVDHTSDRLVVTARELDDGTLDPIADLSAESPSPGADRDADRGSQLCRRARHPGRCRHPGRRRRGRRRLGGGPRRALRPGRTAWAVDRYCTTGNTGLIRGPVSLD